jgi:hypothetical protein
MSIPTNPNKTEPEIKELVDSDIALRLSILRNNLGKYPTDFLKKFHDSVSNKNALDLAIELALSRNNDDRDFQRSLATIRELVAMGIEPINNPDEIYRNIDKKDQNSKNFNIIKKTITEEKAKNLVSEFHDEEDDKYKKYKTELLRSLEADYFSTLVSSSANGNIQNKGLPNIQLENIIGVALSTIAQSAISAFHENKTENDSKKFLDVFTPNNQTEREDFIRKIVDEIIINQAQKILSRDDTRDHQKSILISKVSELLGQDKTDLDLKIMIDKKLIFQAIILSSDDLIGKEKSNDQKAKLIANKFLELSKKYNEIEDKILDQLSLPSFTDDDKELIRKRCFTCLSTSTNFLITINDLFKNFNPQKNKIVPTAIDPSNSPSNPSINNVKISARS